MDVVTLGGCRVHLMPVVRGLVSEGERVRAAFADAGPEAVALSISREELQGLRDYTGGNAPPDNLEDEREGFLARRIRQLSSKYGVLLALVEVERAKGVRNRLG